MNEPTARNDLTQLERYREAQREAVKKDEWVIEAMGDVKVKINEFLYKMLPGGTTLSEMEDFAVEIFKKMTEEWGKQYDRLF